MRILARTLLALLAIGSVPGTARAQGEPVSPERIDTQRAAVEADTALGEEARKQALAMLEEARTRIGRRDEWIGRRTQLQATLDGAEAELVTLRRTINEPTARSLPRIDIGMSVAELEASQAAEDQQRRTADEQRAQAVKALADLETRRTELPPAVATARAERTEVQTLIGAAAPPDEHASATAARRLRDRARLERVEAQLAAYDLEQGSLERVAALWTARRDAATADRDAAAARAQSLQQQAADQRRQEIDGMERAARTLLREADPRIRSIAQENVALVEGLRALAKRRDDLAAASAQAKHRSQRLEEDLVTSKSREKAVGLTEAMGLELRELRRSQLNDIEKVRRANRALRVDQIAAYTTRFEFENRKLKLEGDDDAVGGALAAAKVPVAERPELEQETRTLLDARRRLLGELVDGYGALTRDYGEADAQQQTLLTTAANTARFVDERVLWIPSGRPVWGQSFATLPTAAARLATLWVDATRAVVRQFFAQPAVPIAFALLIAVLVAARSWLRRRLAAHALAIRQRGATRFWPTLAALGDTLLLAAPALVLPLALATVLAQSGEVPAVQAALRAITPLAATIALIYALLRPDGLGLVHFGWDKDPVRIVRRNLRVAAPILIAARAVEVTLESQQVDELSATLGRLALLVRLLTYLWLFRGVLHPTRGALATATAFAARSKLRHFAHLTGMGLPLALAILTLLGWVFTAAELSVRLERTAVLVMAVALVGSLALRWFLLSRRSLAIEQAREKRRRAASAVEPDAEARELEAEERAIDLATVDQQTRSLLRTGAALGLVLGIWAIWVDVLPALGLLREVPIWSEMVQTTVTVTGADGIERSELRIAENEITLANLLLALVALGVTWVLARNVGGLIEMLVLRHIGMSAGGRYATTTVIRYAIVLIGSLSAFSTVGIGWNKVQWLAAGVSVGLGFGLQEIFANFVSGLILLFERPLRVGDLVTVSGFDGRVTKIRMRATTIVDFNRKELIVPNREFVTGHFVNWSLSNPIIRAVIKVGVAYGTDTQKARRLLEEAARACPQVLADPPPDAVFRGFGDSTLDLELRIFHHTDDWGAVMNGVHEAVDAAFRAQGIEIAFPQRDLHLRSAVGLAEQLGQAAQGPRRDEPPSQP